jgi:hypothetical protein
MDSGSGEAGALAVTGSLQRLFDPLAARVRDLLILHRGGLR